MPEATEQKVSISTRIPRGLYERIKQEAEKEKRSMAQIIELTLENTFIDSKITNNKKGANK